MAQARIRFLDDHEHETRQALVETDGNHKVNDWLTLDGALWLVAHIEVDGDGNETLTVVPI